MSGPEVLTADDVVDWLPPRIAVELLSSHFGEDTHLAKTTLLDRLKAGMVHSVAANVVVNDQGRVSRDRFVPIPASEWRYVRTDDNVWMNGDLIQTIMRSPYSETITSYFAVSFDPQGVGNIIGAGSDPRPPLPDPKRDTNPESQSQEVKGKPVSPANLQAWFTFYKSVTPQSEDTEDYAWMHARQCFPNNSVSRDRVRELRGSQRRGPKPKAGTAK